MQNMTLRLITLAVKDMMAGTKPSLHPLAQLEHAVLRAPSTHSFPWFHIVYVAPFFYLPKLKFLATADMGTGGGPLRDVHDDEPSWVQGGSRRVVLDPDLYIPHFPIGTSPIETLILDRACFTSSGFLVLVRACKRIKRLAICVDRYMDLDHREVAWQEDNNRVVANLEDLSKAIAYHASSLEEVTFGLMYESHWEKYRHYHKTTAPLALYDCLKNMERLKRLTIHIEFLYRQVTTILWNTEVELVIDRLPPTLEHLVLVRNEYVDAMLMSQEMQRYRMLLDQCGPGGRFSKLQSLTLPLCYGKSRGCHLFKEVEELEILAASKGVQVIFRRDPEDYSVSLVPKPYPSLRKYRREQSDLAF
ncbi:hypothetical protein FIE12Z_790 [Fusarium flagelliforme]|uniref:Uncharacterized protein n=1 Tax=Fusarium flagelliforme TaxID=2675880 RepID=A0A395N587_9HYPO|nr:hypothetical protein FIE12Z_790 [Fusarium flagelliforme]